MFIRCAMGHIPSNLSIGEITTPIATSIDKTTSFKSLFESFIFFSSFQKIYTKDKTSAR